MSHVSRRTVLGAGAALGAGAVVVPSASASAAPADPADRRTDRGGGPHRAPARDPLHDATDPGQWPRTDSTFVATTFVQRAGTYAAPGSDGDLWPNCWADDDYVYAANGDGRGFSDEPFKDVVVNRISGTPETGLSGEKLAESEQVANVWADPAKYNRKPTGMVCVNGVLYLAVQDLHYGPNAFDDVPNASISRSDDHGRTWKKTSTAMFSDYRFTTIFFVDFGKDSQHAKTALGDRDGSYVYAYGMDWNWRTSNSGAVSDPVDLYLGRVPADHVQDRSRWQFFTGCDHDARPRWSSRIEDKVPVLHDPLRRYADTQPDKGGNLTVVSQGGVLYDAPLKRYLYTSWSDPSFEFYEAPNPWGPWRRFHYQNAGLVPWYRSNDTTHTPKNGGYGTTLPSKFVSADGRSMWMQSNWWNAPAPTPADNYNFNLRRVRIEPWRPARPANRPNPKANLARTGAGVTVTDICEYEAHYTYLNDGNRSKAETSNDGTNKNIDFWGYTFTAPYWMNRVVYTAGSAESTGGYFTAYAGGLRVQVRRDFEWVDVEGLRVSPDYDHDAGVAHKTFTLRFDPTWGDGVRIIGQPGGSLHFTSIAELEVYYGG